MRGLSILPVDVIRAGSVGGVISASVMEKPQEISDHEESISPLEQRLRQDLPVDSIRLNINDRVEITAATALQAGMLSQVISTQTELAGYMRDLLALPCRPSLPRDNSMSTPLRSGSRNHAESSS
jgi:hypothetical protein